MKKNFTIKDGVLFEFSGELVDIRGDCELTRIEYCPGVASFVTMNWKVDGNNRQLQMLFKQIDDLIVRGRDEEYPYESGTILKIAGFVSGASDGADCEFYVEPTQERSYMSFVMDDKSMLLIRAGSASMRWM